MSKLEVPPRGVLQEGCRHDCAQGTLGGLVRHAVDPEADCRFDSYEYS